jgi:glucuronoarabinoxylan endo-1,4-beta-xylanase
MRLLAFAVLASFVLSAEPILVTWHDAEQIIDGFGASTAGIYGNTNYDKTLYETMFGKAGIGLSIFRMEAYGDLQGCQMDIGPTGACVGSSAPYFDRKAIEIAQYAIDQGALVFVTMWFPPASLVCAGGGNCTGSSPYVGTFKGTPQSYTTLTAIQSAIPGALASYGIPVTAISIQNEPDYRQNSVTWTAQQFHDYIPYLSSALASAGYPGVKIMMPEESGQSEGLFPLDLALTSLADPSIAVDIGILAAHGYGTLPVGTGSIVPLALTLLPKQHLWQTEDSSFDAFDGSITNGLMWAQVIHGYLTTARVSAWSYWWMSCLDPGMTSYSCKDNEGLTDSQGNIAKRAYAIGHWAKFVRPGWQRVGVINSGSLLVTAFEDVNSTNRVVVVINSSRSAANQEFRIGLGSLQVTPWITSMTQSLSAQSEVTVSGGAFSYTIPAQSVVTFTFKNRHVLGRSPRRAF